jgi:transposase
VALAYALGGQAAVRGASPLSRAASRDTRLRRLGRGAPPRAPTPRGLGVDDWAWRRGQRYGTVRVDRERRPGVDRLPDRRAETRAAGLGAPPGVPIVSRDRAGAYAEGARQGAPQAVPVADRGPRLKHRREALEGVLRSPQAERRAAAPALPADDAPSAEGAVSPPRRSDDGTPTGSRR